MIGAARGGRISFWHGSRWGTMSPAYHQEDIIAYYLTAPVKALFTTGEGRRFELNITARWDDGLIDLKYFEVPSDPNATRLEDSGTLREAFERVVNDLVNEGSMKQAGEFDEWFDGQIAEWRKTDPDFLRVTPYQELRFEAGEFDESAVAAQTEDLLQALRGGSRELSSLALRASVLAERGPHDEYGPLALQILRAELKRHQDAINTRSTDDAQSSKPTLQRIKFVPESGVAKKTSWTMLNRSSVFSEKDKSVYMVQAHVSLGGNFPVRTPEEEQDRFTVTMVEGDDDQLTLKVKYAVQGAVSDDPNVANTNFVGWIERTIMLHRDRPEDVEINGKSYRLNYPTRNGGPDSAATSNNAPIFVFYTPPAYQAKRIVVANDQTLTFEGVATDWTLLPDLLRQESERPETVLELAIESFEHITVAELNRCQQRLSLLANQHQFKYASLVGEKPVGSKGGIGTNLVGGTLIQEPAMETGLPRVLNPLR